MFALLVLEDYLWQCVHKFTNSQVLQKGLNSLGHFCMCVSEYSLFSLAEV